MAQRSISFLVVWLLMFSVVVFSQEKLPENFNNSKKMGNPVYSLEKKIIIFNMKDNGLLQASPFTLGYYQKPRINVYPTYYYEHSGFFCQREMDLRKISPLIPKIRLGLIDDVDWMERKPNAVRIR